MPRPEFIPHPYQERAITDVIRDSFHGLFMDPGLGKTAVILEAFRRMRASLDVARMLVIAPLRVCYAVWPAEVEKWRQFAGIRVVNLHGNRRGIHEDADVYVTNPESLKWLFGQRVIRMTERGKRVAMWQEGAWSGWQRRPEMLVIDESTRFKKPGGTWTKTLRRYTPCFGRRVILTGSPFANGEQDIFGQMLVCDEGASLGTLVSKFHAEFFSEVPGSFARGYAKYVAREDSKDKIVERIAPRVTVLRAEDHLKMPERIATDVPVVLEPKVAKLYKELVRDSAAVWDGVELFAGDNEGLVDGASLSKLRQVANGLLYVQAPFEMEKRIQRIHEAKFKALEELLEQVGRPALIIYEFRSEAEEIEKRFGFPRLGGGVDGATAAQHIADWNARKLKALLLHPLSGGHGLNLQDGGDTVIWFGPPWSLELYTQVNARLWRQGQNALSVMIYHLIAKGTIDERIGAVLRQKDARQEEILTAIEEEIAHG